VKLRIARKMERRAVGDAPGHIYSMAQMRVAVQRLRRSWQTHCPIEDYEGFRGRLISDDFHAAYRLESKMIRQQVLLRMRR
jgi:hypothetical protein